MFYIVKALMAIANITVHEDKLTLKLVRPYIFVLECICKIHVFGQNMQPEVAQSNK